MKITLVLMSASLLLSFFVIITQQNTLQEYKGIIVKKDYKLRELQTDPESYKTAVITKNIEIKRQEEVANAQRKAESARALKNLESMMDNASAFHGGMSKASSQIMAAIQRNMLTSSTMFGKSCVVNIRVAPDGLILQVNGGSGDRVVCEAAIVAIRKTSTLPMPKDPILNKKLRAITLTFKPM